jgi:hypothetical protein
VQQCDDSWLQHMPREMQCSAVKVLQYQYTVGSTVRHSRCRSSMVQQGSMQLSMAAS